MPPCSPSRGVDLARDEEGERRPAKPRCPRTGSRKAKRNPPLPSSGMTKSRNCGPCSTSCSAACKRTRVCCVSFPIVIRLWPFETAATSARCCPAGCTGCRKRRGRGRRPLMWMRQGHQRYVRTRRRGYGSAGVRKARRGEAPRPSDVRTAWGRRGSRCSCPMPMRVPCSASLRRSGKPARNGCLSMPIGMCVSASASGAIGLRCRHYRHV